MLLLGALQAVHIAGIPGQSWGQCANFEVVVESIIYKQGIKQNFQVVVGDKVIVM